MKRHLDTLAKAVASVGYLTYLPAALRKDSKTTGAGLIGTAAGLIAWRWVPAAPLEQLCILVGGLFIATAISDRAEQAMGVVDDPRIVLDEWVGIWISMAFLPRSIEYMLLAFVVFRILDVWKPGPIRKLSHFPGGWGVMLDDVLAGLCANLCLQVVRYTHLL